MFALFLSLSRADSEYFFEDITYGNNNIEIKLSDESLFLFLTPDIASSYNISYYSNLDQKNSTITDRTNVSSYLSFGKGSLYIQKKENQEFRKIPGWLLNHNICQLNSYVYKSNSQCLITMKTGNFCLFSELDYNQVYIKMLSDDYAGIYGIIRPNTSFYFNSKLVSGEPYVVVSNASSFTQQKYRVYSLFYNNASSTCMTSQFESFGDILLKFGPLYSSEYSDFSKSTFPLSASILILIILTTAVISCFYFMGFIDKDIFKRVDISPEMSDAAPLVDGMMINSAEDEI